MIDEDRTMQLYGYYSTDLKPKSNKPIICVCENCGEYRKLLKYHYKDLCRICIHKQRFKLPKPKFIIKLNRFIPNTQIDRILTIEKFGYDPIDLKSKSSRKIVVICQKCSKKRIIQMSKYRGLCHKCSMKGSGNPMFGSYRIGELNGNWKGGLTKQPYCKLFSEKFKQLIRDQYHNKCYLCNKSKEDEGRNLAVHHVNYNKSCLCQKTCEFIPLCNSCHAKTNGNRSYWEDLIMNYLYPERYFMVDF